MAGEHLMGVLWPQVLEAVPTAMLDVYGSGLSEDLRTAWAAVPGVRVVGRYQHEWEPYAGDVVAVAPLPYGGGVKGKVVTALGHGAAVVGTSFAAEGLPNDVRAAIRVAEDDSDLVGAIAWLLKDHAGRKRLGDMGIAAYDRNFSQASGRKAVSDALDRILGTGSAGT
jgi:glycosyltransferase involved in cell wall biosynthesis